MNIKEAKDRVAQQKGYSNWEECYNWMAREGEKPEVVAQQIESAMTEVINLMIISVSINQEEWRKSFNNKIVNKCQ